MRERYAELREAIPDATPGPWEHDAADPSEFFIPSPSVFRGQVRWGNVVYSDPGRSDARYIAAANPSVVAALLAERDALHEALRNARAWVNASTAPNAILRGIDAILGEES